MLKNYFKIAWRNLQKHKFYTFLNIIGLASGLSFTLAIGAYIWQESAYDSKLKNLSQQYILRSEWKSTDIGIPVTTLGSLPKALKEEYPDLVRNYYRFDGITCILSRNDQIFSENAALGDSTLLSMYDLPLLAGDPHTALKDPFSVVITDDLAMKYFGKTDVLGEQLNIRNFNGEDHPFTITAVLNKLPNNSVTHLNESLNNKVFLSSEAVNFFNRNIDSWQNPYIAGFVELQPGVTSEMLKQPLRDLLKKHADEKIAQHLTPVLHPLSNYHLKKDNGLIEKMLYTLGLIAGFILLMAIINFINISINGSTSRLKEIGIRKVMGSNRKQLKMQFLSESILLVSFAFALALCFYPFLIPAFSVILGQDLPSLLSFSWPVWLTFLFGGLALGFLTGLYPAFRLSGLPSVSSVKGQIPRHFGNASFLRSLIGFQFIIALAVFMAAGIISRQVSLFFGNDLGYDKASLITVKVPRDWSEAGLNHIKSVQYALKNLPEVENISLSYDVPGGQGLMATGMLNFSKETGSMASVVSGQYILSDTLFASTYKIPMLAGKFLDDQINPKQAKIVITEKASQRLGFAEPREAINQQVYLKPNDFPATIVGVSKDFYAASMRDPLSPVVWTNVKADHLFRFFSIRLKPGNLSQSLTHLEKEWRNLVPDAPFEYRFADENIDMLYQTELRLSYAGYTATALASLIVFLGIIGLVSLNVQKRKKEIGVRKVLGATINSIIGLFMRDLFPIFIIALFVACPLVFLLMTRWLEQYSMKITLTPLFFILPATTLALVTASIISLQTFKTARSNPINSLRDE